MNEYKQKSKIANHEKLSIDQDKVLYIGVAKNGMPGPEKLVHMHEHDNQENVKKSKEAILTNETLFQKEKIEKSLKTKLEEISVIMNNLETIPEYAKKQIEILEGSESVLEQKIKEKIKSPLQKIRDVVGNKFAKVAAIVGLVGVSHYGYAQGEDGNGEIKSVNKKIETLFTAKEKDGQFLIKSSKYPKLFERFVQGEDKKLYSLGFEDEKGVTVNPEKELNPERFVDPEKYAEEDVKNEMNNPAWQKYLSKIYEIQQDPEHYIENKTKKDFEFLSTSEGLNSYKNDLEKELLFRLDRIAQIKLNKENHPEVYLKLKQDYDKEISRHAKLVDDIRSELEKINNQTWTPSLEKIQQEVQKDFDKLMIEYDDEDLPVRKKNIDEVVKEVSDYFDETKEYTKNRVSRDQEMYYHYDDQLGWLNSNIKSPEYIKRIQKFEGFTIADVQKRLLFLNKNDYKGTSDLSENRVEVDSKTGNVLDVKFKLRYSADKDDEHNHRLTGIHEGQHASTANQIHMSQYAVDLYKKALNKDARVTVYGENDEKYFFRVDGSDNLSQPTELDARKKTTEYFLEKSGIKKYAEKFTIKHYEKLLKLLQEGSVPNDVRQFLEMVKPEYVEQIMNTIADNLGSNESLDNHNNINQV